MDLKNRLRFYLKIESLGKENRSFPAAGKIMVSVWGKGPALSAGNRLMFKSKIKKIRNFNNPGRFDYKRYMTFKKIWGTAHVSSRKLTILAGGPAIIKGRIIEKARKKITGLIEKTPDGEQKGVYKALIVGDRNDISPAVRKAFNRAGAGHLLAISGLHIGIVATVAFVFFRWLFSYIPPPAATRMDAEGRCDGNADTDIGLWPSCGDVALNPESCDYGNGLFADVFDRKGSGPL